MALTPEQKSFIEKVGRIAGEDMKKSGVLASLTIAQAILESGWGTSGLAKNANNFFGIKVGSAWKGKVYVAETEECLDGVNQTTVVEKFRDYGSLEESVSDHSALFTGLDRYRSVIGERDYRRACRAVAAAGYATDPAYAGKLIDVIEKYGLAAYDLVALKGAGVMKASDFVAKLRNIEVNYLTVYMWGVFGAPVTEAVIKEKARQYPSWYTAQKQAELRGLIGKGYFGFDCVNLIKGVLWGWCGDKSKSYGGAVYPSAGDVAGGACPDINADTMISRCVGVSTDFSTISPGEAVWVPGHIGVYVGDGKVIEATPSWKNRVQTTACLNIGIIAGLNGRKWQKHGKMSFVEYGLAADVKAGDTVTKTGGSAFKTGNVVTFTGGNVYMASDAAGIAAVKNITSRCKVTRVYDGKHPYHVVSEDGKGVYGWVDAGCVTE